MAAIYFDSGAPTIFRQKRIGRNGRVFTCFKLRTMPTSTANVASHELVRIELSGLGRNLRKFKLDELPQLLNVLLGQMSLVGPRPCLPQQLQLIELRQSKNVLSQRPGITGLAQINDIDMSDPIKLVSVEERYLKQASFLLDLKILMATFSGRGMATDAARKIL